MGDWWHLALKGMNEAEANQHVRQVNEETRKRMNTRWVISLGCPEPDTCEEFLHEDGGVTTMVNKAKEFTCEEAFDSDALEALRAKWVGRRVVPINLSDI